MAVARPMGMPRVLMLGGAIIVVSIGLAAMTMSQTSGVAPAVTAQSPSNATSPTIKPNAVVYSRQPLWLQRPRTA